MGYLGAGWFHVVGGNHCGEPMSLEYRLEYHGKSGVRYIGKQTVTTYET